MTKMADVFAIFTDERLDFPLMSRIYKSGFTRIPVLRRRQPSAPVEARKRSDRRHARKASEPPQAPRQADAEGGDAAEGSGLQQTGEEELATPSHLEVGAEAGAPMRADSQNSMASCSAEEDANSPESAEVVPSGAAPSGTHVKWIDQLGEERPEVVGLLSAKDLILIDPEDALSVETLLAHCGRDVMRVWNDTPVNQLFKEFTRGSSHLAFVQRRLV